MPTNGRFSMTTHREKALFALQNIDSLIGHCLDDLTDTDDLVWALDAIHEIGALAFNAAVSIERLQAELDLEP